MRILISIVAAILLAACGTNQQTASKSSSPPPANPPETAKAEKPPEANQASPAESGPPPVDFTFLGFKPDKQEKDIAWGAYRIKVNTNKPIEQVDLTCKETDSSGKVVENTVVWQNIVKSKQQPIESGKTYEDQAEFYPAPAKAECSLKRVVFEDPKTHDLTSWSAR